MGYSEKSFGARTENAQKLLIHLKSFKNYEPLDTDLEIKYLEKLITEAKKQGDKAIDDIEVYSSAVEERQQAYLRSPDSLYNLASPIMATIRAIYGKESKESQTVANLFTKIRGSRPRKPGQSADDNRISQSQRSFGNMSQALSDLLTTISRYKYNPANPSISIAKLEDLHAKLEETNQNVTKTYGAQKQSRDARQLLFEQLNQTSQRIKDAIKSQYGPQSTEYKLVKGLMI